MINFDTVSSIVIEMKAGAHVAPSTQHDPKVILDHAIDQVAKAACVHNVKVYLKTSGRESEIYQLSYDGNNPWIVRA